MLTPLDCSGHPGLRQQNRHPGGPRRAEGAGRTARDRRAAGRTNRQGAAGQSGGAGSSSLEECDTLLIVGSGFSYIEYYPRPRQARAIQIDIDSTRLSLRYPIEAAIVGDAALSLRALMEQLRPRSDRGFLARIQRTKKAWQVSLEDGAKREGQPLKPPRVVRDLNLRLADDAVIVTDCGHNTGLAAQYVTMRADQLFGVSGTLGSIGRWFALRHCRCFGLPRPPGRHGSRRRWPFHVPG